MRKIYYVLLLIFVFACTACSQADENSQEEVHFYYCSYSLLEESCSDVIAAEPRTDLDPEDRLDTLLQLYFQGPVSADFYSPFPASVTVMEYAQQDSVVCIFLSSSFSDLKGIDQTLAGTCLATTVTEFTGCTTVEIYASAPGDLQQPIMVFGPQSLLLYDNSQ